VAEEPHWEIQSTLEERDEFAEHESAVGADRENAFFVRFRREA